MTLHVYLGFVKCAESQRQYMIHKYIKHSLEGYQV